jgi:4-hydroxyphenylpyruvate dioxygenase-like putative hemolysin
LVVSRGTESLKPVPSAAESVSPTLSAAACEATEGRKGTVSVRLVLNASQSRHTLASRFLDDFFGSGVQQIALATEDIFHTVERLRANSVELLPIPENYYDDLNPTDGGVPGEQLRILGSRQ